MEKLYRFENEKGRAVHLTMGRDEDGHEIWSAFTGSNGGCFRQWKTYERAKKEMEAKGWAQIGDELAEKRQALKNKMKEV